MQKNRERGSVRWFVPGGSVVVFVPFYSFNWIVCMCLWFVFIVVGKLFIYFVVVVVAACLFHSGGFTTSNRSIISWIYVYVWEQTFVVLSLSLSVYLVHSWFPLVLLPLSHTQTNNIVNWILGEKGQHKNAAHCLYTYELSGRCCHLPKNVHSDTVYTRWWDWNGSWYKFMHEPTLCEGRRVWADVKNEMVCVSVCVHVSKYPFNEDEVRENSAYKNS